MAERFRSAIESLFNVRDEANSLAAGADDRRRKRNDFIETLRNHSVPVLLMAAAAGVIVVAVHFLVWSLIGDVIMPLVYTGAPGLETIQVGETVASTLSLGQFIAYLLYAAIMISLATLTLRAMLAKPIGYVRERTRPCPACGMTVLEAASKCRFCGSPLSARRSHGPSPRGRGNGLAISSPRTSAESESRDGPPRRGRRGGRRRGGRRRSDSGPRSGGSGRSSRSDRPDRSDRDRGPSQPADSGSSSSST